MNPRHREKSPKIKRACWPPIRMEWRFFFASPAVFDSPDVLASPSVEGRTGA